MKNNSIKKRKLRSRGIGIVELLLVVGFAAAVVVAVYSVYQQVQSTNAANEESKNVDALRAGVKNIYGTQVAYNGLTNQVLINARSVPDNLIGDGDEIRNNFGGEVEVQPATFNGPNNNAFSITYTQVPVSVCAKFVTQAGSAFNKVEIGGTVVKDSSSNNADGRILDVAETANQCSSAAGAGATIVFTSL